MLPHPEICLIVTELHRKELIARAANEQRESRPRRDRLLQRALLSAGAIALLAAIAHALTRVS